MDSSPARRSPSFIKSIETLGKLGCGLVCLAFTLSSCQPSTPAIIQTFTQLNHRFNPATKDWSERLAVWAQVQNKDGWTDIQKIVIRHPASEVWWKLDKTNWAYRQDGEAIWLGTNNLESTEGSPLPTGTWTVTVVTKAGQTSESEFTLPAPLGVIKPAPLPKPVFQAKAPYKIEHFPLPCLAWVYDSQGNFIGSLQLTDHVVSSPLLNPPPVQGPPQARWLVFYAKDSQGQGLEAGPYFVH